MYGPNFFISIFLTIVSIYFSTINFSGKKITIKSLLIFHIIITPILIVVSLYSDGVLRILLNISIVTLSLYFSLFNKKIMDAIYYALVYEIFAFILEIILSILFVSLSNFNLDNNYNTLMIVFTFLNSLCIYLISLIKPINKLIQKINKKVLNSKSETLYGVIIIAIMMTMMAYNIKNFAKTSSFYINAVSIIFIFMTSLYILHRDFQNEKLENRYNEMIQYLCRYEKIINDQGKKNHEYNNQLMVIKGYINNPKKLEEYLSLIIEEHKCGQNYTIRQLSYFLDGGIKGLIYDKLSKMEENNIKNYLYVDKNAKNIFEDKYDLKTYQDITKLLGVFLDNAIEASLTSKQKEVELEIKEDKDCSIIIISNTFSKDADLKQIGRKGFSTKGYGHGYGLSIAKDISKHNKNIETFSNIEENKFKQTIIAYYTKEK